MVNAGMHQPASSGHCRRCGKQRHTVREILNLTWDNIDLRNGYLLVPQ